MICVIALVVFGILGIFSATHRKIAFKAFDCVFRKMTLRPCNSSLDQQLKTSIVGFVSKRNMKAARFVVRHFEILSWAFTILMFASIFFSAQGLYFYAVYGNCNGEDTDQFCVFDALHASDEVSVCADPGVGQVDDFTHPSPEGKLFIGPEDAKVTIIEFGCYSCPYTKKAEPLVKEILKNYEGRIKFVYMDFHIPSHPGSEERAMAAHCADDQGKFWEYHEMLFEKQEQNLDFGALVNIATELDMNTHDFTVCLETEKYAESVNRDFEIGKNAGVYGTPTFFINDKVVVGIKPYRYMKNIIDSELRS
jgi:protein-disulfide isomerase